MNKFRKRVLSKLSQNIDNLSATEVSKNKSVSGSPTSFIATNYYPNIITWFTDRNVPIINSLTDILNQALYYLSDGKIQLSLLYSNGFSYPTDNIISMDLKNIIGFIKQLYNEIYINNGSKNIVKLSPDQISNKIKLLQSNQYLNNLSSNISGQLSSKIGGNLKTIINNYLYSIK